MLYDAIGDDDVSWAGLPYREVRVRAERDGSVLIVPVASLEQHGHHLPTATDTILCGSIATATAERLHPDVPVLVTPPVWTGYSPHHLSVGGTVSAEHDRLLGLLGDVVGTSSRNGFDATVLLNGHGGNASLVSSAAAILGRRYADRTETLGLTYFALARAFADDIRESDRGGIAHGGEMETAMMLHLRPDLVDEDSIAGTPWETPYELASCDLLDGAPLAMYTEIGDSTDSGALGRPDLASAEKGERFFEGFLDELGALLVEIHERHA